LNDAHQVAGVTQITVLQLKVGFVNVRALINVIHPLCLERAGAAFEAVNNVTIFQQKFSQVRTIMACDARDQGVFGLVLYGHN
jgi:hypothetical protein